MLAEKPHFNFSFDKKDHTWYLGNASGVKFDIDKIRAFLADYYPFADLDKLLEEANSSKLRIFIENDKIEIGETKKDEILIRSLIPDDFQMLLCYIPKECSVLLHKPLSVKLKHDSIDGIIKKQLIEDFIRSEEDSFHIISRGKQSDNFKYEVKRYLDWGDQISIEFTSVEQLEGSVRRKLANYNTLSDLSPFFMVDASVEDLIKKVCTLFNEIDKSGNTKLKPTLSIKPNAIEYLAGDKHPQKLYEFNRYKDGDDIAKDLCSLFKSVREYKNLKNLPTNTSNVNVKDTGASQSSGSIQGDKSTALVGDDCGEGTQDNDQSKQEKIEAQESTATGVKLLTFQGKSQRTTLEERKSLNDKLQLEKYHTHLKPVKNEDGFTKFTLGIAGGHPNDPVIGKKINKNLVFSELVGELERLFFPEKSGLLIDAIAERVITQQVNLNFSHDTSGASKSWSVEVSGNFTKEESERKQQELKKREEKVAERERNIACQEAARKQLLNMVKQIRLEFALDEEADVLSHIRELKKSSDKARSDYDELKLITNLLDTDLFSLKTKFESLTTHLSIFTVDNHGLDKIGAAQFDDLLLSLKDSYVKLESIHNLRGYDGSVLKAFSAALGDVKSYIMDAVDKLEKSFTSINERFVVCDAIRSRLSNPELRKLKLPSLDVINQELEHYGLCIFLPAQDVPAEPSRHKVVGYESGGVRGTISSVLSWGVLETGEGVSTGSTIFKAEVKIYQ